MPLPRIMMLAFAGAAAVPVLSGLIRFDGWLPDAAGVLALLVAAAAVVVFVRGPVVRRALAAGIVVLAAVSVVGWLFLDDLPPVVTSGDVRRIYEQRADADFAGALLLLVATAALTVGVAALPQFRRPVWPTALACVVALVPVAIVADDASGSSDLPFTDPVPASLWWHLAPGFAATVLAGLTLVLAVSRAERWHLLPAGALLVQVTAAHWAWSSSGAWTVARLFGADGTAFSSAFLQPGLRTDASATATMTLDVDFGAALATAAFLIGPALIAAGAVRTASAAGTVHEPPADPADASGEPDEPDERERPREA